MCYILSCGINFRAKGWRKWSIVEGPVFAASVNPCTVEGLVHARYLMDLVRCIGQRI